MSNFMTLLTDMAWPITILLAWFAGEFMNYKIGLPRISTYAFVGFILAPSQLGLLPQIHSATMLLLANIAFGLILFECGYRINLHWLRTNPWITATSLTEAAFTFGAIYFLVKWFGQPPSTALLLAALSMATSPATIIRVINEQRSAGQVTERVLHFSALNIWNATYNSLIILSASSILGAVSGVVVPALLRLTKRTNYDSTLAFTIAVIGLVMLTHSLKLSPVLATLTFGMSARHRRIVLNSSQRGFGALGDLLSILLFVFIASTLEWKHVITGIGMGLAIIAVRQIAKLAGITIFAHISGISWRKGMLIGMAMTPISAFVILLLEQTRYIGIELVDQLAPLAAAALTLEVFGPIFTQRALIWAHEVPETKES